MNVEGSDLKFYFKDHNVSLKQHSTMRGSEKYTFISTPMDHPLDTPRRWRRSWKGSPSTDSVHTSIIIVMNLDFLESLRMRLEDLKEDDQLSAELVEDDREVETTEDYKIHINVDRDGRVLLKRNQI